MKLYTRNHLILSTSIAIILALAGGVAIGKFVLGQVEKNSVAQTISQEIPAANTTNSSTVALSGDYTESEKENINVYEKINDAVVNITTETVALNWFMEPVPQDGGSGSGSIIDARGYVLTNNHVIKDATKIYINLSDGTRYEAKIVGIDNENDLAVLQFTPPSNITLHAISFGSSSNLKVGQKVLAIGNPFGLERTLTDGIISGLGRPIQDSGRIIRDMIQTDASINPGNSGGPLLNARGELIGINTMIYSPSGGSVGIGFAIPVNTAKRVVPELIKNGSVSRGWIEASYVQLFPQLVEYMKEQGQPVPTQKGLLISQTVRGGNAEKVGLQGGKTTVRYGRSYFYIGGDILTMVDGVKITSVADLYAAIEDNKPGETVAIEYYHGNKKMTGQVTLVDRAKYVKAAGSQDDN